MSKILILTFCVLAGTAQAKENQDYSKSGDWQIKVNPNNGNGCFMEKSFERASLIQVGIVPDKGGAFFATYKADLSNYVEGEVSQLLFDFGDSRFQGEIVGATFDGLTGGYAFFDNPEFALEFGRRLSVILIDENGDTKTIDLAGSKLAIEVVKECQKTMK